MIAYALRRLFYALPILVGVNLFTFVLFFVVNPPDAVARAVALLPVAGLGSGQQLTGVCCQARGP